MPFYHARAQIPALWVWYTSGAGGFFANSCSRSRNRKILFFVIFAQQTAQQQNLWNFIILLFGTGITKKLVGSLTTLLLLCACVCLFAAWISACLPNMLLCGMDSRLPLADYVTNGSATNCPRLCNNRMPRESWQNKN